MLRRAFLTTGLPRRITFDHGTVFYDNTSPSPFPTRLHLWLVALGIDICFTRKRCPTDYAKIERTHQTMTLQARHGPALVGSPGALGRTRCTSQHARVRTFPAVSFKVTPPLQAYPQAEHSGRISRPEWEADMLAPFAGLCVFGHLSLVSPHPGQRTA